MHSKEVFTFDQTNLRQIQLYFIDSVQTLLHVYVDPPFHEDLIVRIEVEAEKLEEDQVVQTQLGPGASAKPDEPVERLRKLWQDFSTLFCWIFLLKNPGILMS